jgi:predicted nucleic acid-binding protein
MPYILDTNIISELMNETPNLHVIQWIDEQPVGDLFISSITVAEILFGINRLELSKRKSRLAQQAALIIDMHFEQKIYNFDKHSAVFYADIRQARSKLGLPMSHADCQIAAIACQYNCTLVT